MTLGNSALQLTERFFQAANRFAPEFRFLDISTDGLACTTFSALSLPARRRNSSYFGKNVSPSVLNMA